MFVPMGHLGATPGHLRGVATNEVSKSQMGEGQSATSQQMTQRNNRMCTQTENLGPQLQMHGGKGGGVGDGGGVPWPQGQSGCAFRFTIITRGRLVQCVRAACALPGQRGNLTRAETHPKPSSVIKTISP